jgi:hypothetical protein
MIAENVKAILKELPPGVMLAAAAKTRTPAEIIEAVEAGVAIIGENYVQEAEKARAGVEAMRGGPLPVRWHMIGRLQKNKAKKAVEIFDMIETVDSVELAVELNRRAAAAGKTVEVLIEVNSGREPQKAGALPEDVESLARSIAGLDRLRLLGLMTMGPFEGDPEDARPYFRETRRLFEALRPLDIPNATMSWLSMGMTNSWRVAVEEGATLVRIGTGIFGPRG